MHDNVGIPCSNLLLTLSNLISHLVGYLLLSLGNLAFYFLTATAHIN